MLTINRKYRKSTKTHKCFIVCRSKKNLKRETWKHTRTFFNYEEMSEYFKQLETSKNGNNYEYLISKSTTSFNTETIDSKVLLIQRIKYGF